LKAGNLTDLANRFGRPGRQSLCGFPRHPVLYLFFAVFCGCSSPLLASQVVSEILSPQQIVRLSIKTVQADWKAAPEFSDIERDQDHRNDENSSRTYRIWMMDGSPYAQLLAIDNEALSPARAARECSKLRAEIEERANESPEDRARRIREYQAGESRRFALIAEMADAFEFKLLRREKLENHDVYVIAATPRPDYQPRSWKTRILKGMEGTLWIEAGSYQWVKVEAFAVRPVWFGGFIAKVLPGTRFVLKQTPVKDGLWLPDFFSFQARARILGWRKDYSHIETYSNYRPMADSAKSLTSAQALFEDPTFPCRDENANPPASTPGN
jgi:hypothetical protein